MTNPMLQHLQPTQNSATPTPSVTGSEGMGARIKQAMDYVRANGGDARTAFYRLAQQKGVDPESILRNLR